MSNNRKYNLNTKSNVYSSFKEKNSTLDIQDSVKVTPLSLTYKSPADILKIERAKNIIFVKQLQKEARKARLKSLFEMDSSGKIKYKTRREYIQEFITNMLNDSTFIAID